MRKKRILFQSILFTGRKIFQKPEHFPLNPSRPAFAITRNGTLKNFPITQNRQIAYLQLFGNIPLATQGFRHQRIKFSFIHNKKFLI